LGKNYGQPKVVEATVGKAGGVEPSGGPCSAAVSTQLPQAVTAAIAGSDRQPVASLPREMGLTPSISRISSCHLAPVLGEMPVIQFRRRLIRGYAKSA
jgi:hypothetical protein